MGVLFLKHWIHHWAQQKQIANFLPNSAISFSLQRVWKGKSVAYVCARPPDMRQEKARVLPLLAWKTQKITPVMRAVWMGAVIFLSPERVKKQNRSSKENELTHSKKNICLESQVFIAMARSGVMVFCSESVQLVAPRFDGQTLDWSETRYLSQSLLKNHSSETAGVAGNNIAKSCFVLWNSWELNGFNWQLRFLLIRDDWALRIPKLSWILIRRVEKDIKIVNMTIDFYPKWHIALTLQECV